MKTTTGILIVIGSLFCGACAPKINEVTMDKKVPFLDATWTGANYSTVLQAHDVNESFANGKSWDNLEVDGNLYNGSGSDVDGGTFDFNGTSVTKHTFTSGVSYNTSNSDGGTVSLSFNGAFHVFAISGSSSYSSFTDSLRSPNGSMAVSAPTIASTLSRSSSYTVTWSYTTASSNTVLIQVTDTTGTGIVQKTVSDNGTYTLTSTDLSGLAAGPIKVAVSRINYREGTDSNSRNYVLALWTTKITDCTLSN